MATKIFQLASAHVRRPPMIRRYIKDTFACVSGDGLVRWRFARWWVLRIRAVSCSFGSKFGFCSTLNRLKHGSFCDYT